MKKTNFGTFSKEVRRDLLRKKALIFYIYTVRPTWPLWSARVFK